MRRFAIIFIAMVLGLAAGTNPRQTYIEKYSKLAISEMKRTGVPASITMAQGILESNSGQSTLAVKGNNHFGIKCHNDWTGKKMHADDDAPNECFRVYASAEASYRDHSDFLRSQDRYKSLFELQSTDYKGWAKGLKKAGYATDPAYATKLIDLIEDFSLYRLDEGVAVNVASPASIETPRELSATGLGKNYRESFSFSFTRRIYVQNGVPFIYSVEGESYSSIAAANKLFLKELLRFNDLTEERELEPGTVVYLARKKVQGPEGAYRYTVGSDGETLYDISQRFGIRLAELQKLNIVLYQRPLEEGDSIRLRKK